MQLGNANLGDEGDEGKGPSSLEQRVGAAVGGERCNAVTKNKAPGARRQRQKCHQRWSRVCVSGGGCREMQQEEQILAARVTKAKSHRRWSRVWERRWVS
jgi:hypothetical protein